MLVDLFLVEYSIVLFAAARVYLRLSIASSCTARPESIVRIKLHSKVIGSAKSFYGNPPKTRSSMSMFDPYQKLTAPSVSRQVSIYKMLAGRNPSVMLC